MKGFLVKDLALFKKRKRTFLFLALWAIVMCFITNDGAFATGWMTIIASFFAISSLSYDEYDNCYPFLMSLPVTGRTYAVEKYVFGFLCGFVAWIYSAVIFFVYTLVNGSADGFFTELAMYTVFIPLFMILLDIGLPLNIKYGVEKGRIAMLILWGVVFACFFLASKLLRVNISLETLDSFDPGMLLLLAFVITAILTLISMMISVRVMNRKEF